MQEHLHSDPAARAAVKAKMRRLAAIFRLTREDSEDLEQDLWLELVKGLRRYGRDLLQSPALIHCIVDRCGQQYLRRRFALKRDRRVSSLDLLMDELGDAVEPSAEDEELADFELRHDLAVELSLLSPALQELAVHLMHYSVSDIARQSGVDRSTVTRRLKWLRSAAESINLEDFL